MAVHACVCMCVCMHALNLSALYNNCLTLSGKQIYLKIVRVQILRGQAFTLFRIIRYFQISFFLIVLCEIRPGIE